MDHNTAPGTRRPHPARSLAHTHPELAAQWDTEANEEFGPLDVRAGSRLKVWWTCSEGHGRYCASVFNRASRGSGCPGCALSRLSHPRSANPVLAEANPTLAAQWDHDLNGDFTPDSVTSSSVKKAWWTCSAGHPSYFSRIANRSAGSGCPKCGRKRTIDANITPARDESLGALHPDVAAKWDAAANGEVTPFEVYPGSSAKKAWICSEGHGTYEREISQIVRGFGCPACAEQRRADGRTIPAPGRALADTHPAIAAEWDTESNAPRTAHDVAARSKRVYSWLCPEGHPAYRMRVVDRFNGNKCPVCKPSSAKRVVAG